MLIVLFIFEIIIVGLTIFTTHMVEHKFKEIEMSLAMYCNKRTYKTRANIDFIESIINTYHKLILSTDEEPDLESAIKRKLQNEYIGKFPYISVKNMAIKVRHMMWGILALEFIIAWINEEINSGQVIILITLSLLLTIMMAFYGIIRGVDEKSEALIDEVLHYVRNIYPLEQASTIGVAMPKQNNTISLEEHKVKREYLKANERQMVKEPSHELESHEVQKGPKHKEMARQAIRSFDMNQQESEQNSSQDTMANIITAKVQEETKSKKDQEVCKQQKEKEQIKREDIQLSAKDIAKLLKHL